MKLVEIYIAGFGKLSDLRIRFGSGLNSFKWDNGEGKSTLCDFITAMLYGMGTSTANEKETSQRTRYLPFEGGAFGGTVVFTETVEGELSECRIERTFDKKTLTNDTVKFYVNGELKVSGRNNNIGFEILGVGVDTFRKLIYMNAFSMVPGGNDEISGKIGNFSSDDSARRENASSDLKSAIKELRSNRNVTVGGGRIPVLEKETDRLRIRLRELENEKRRLPEKYVEREELLQKTEKLKKDLEGAAARKRLIEKREDYKSREEAVAAKERRLSEKQKDFPNGFPESAELDKVCAAARDVKVNCGFINALGLTGEDLAELEKTETFIDDARTGKYGDGSVFGVDFDKLEKDIEAQEAAANDASSLEEALKLGRTMPGRAELEKTFEGREDEALRLSSEIESFEKTAQLISEKIKKETAENEMRKEQLRRASTVKAVLGAIFLTAGVIALAAGIVLLALRSGGTALPSVLAACGAVLAVTGMALFAARSRGRGKDAVGNGSDSFKRAYESSKEELSDKLASFGPDYAVPGGTVKFTGDFNTYRLSRKAEREKQDEIEKLRSSASDIERQILEFFGLFEIRGAGPRRCLEALKALKREYISLSEKRKSRAEALEKIKASRAVLSDFIDKYMPGKSLRDLEDDAEAVRSDVKSAKDLAEEIGSEKTVLQGFKAGLGDLEQPLPIDEEEILQKTEALKTCGDLLQEIEIEIRKIESEAALIGEFESKILENEEQIAAATVFRAELELANSLIEKAERNLSDRYIGPVRARFESYKEALSQAIGRQVVMKRDFTVEYEAAGTIRKQDHLSTGQLACVALCVKMALTEGILGEDRCFFVLDDPFMSLSNKNLDAVKTLMRRISADRQIIYLTCSDERMISGQTP